MAKIDLPIPDTLTDAFKIPKKRGDDISHKRNGQPIPENGPYLTSANHAFYLGKEFPETTSAKIRKLMGWGTQNERIYNPNLTRRILDYGLPKLQEGEKLNIILGRTFSEIFNGAEDVEDALTIDEQKKLILDIAKNEFNETERVKITTLEDDPEIATTIDTLKSADSLDPEKIFATANKTELDENSSIITIAYHLYKAYKEHRRLGSHLDKTIPERLRKPGTNQLPLYGIFEIATRLKALTKGRTIHGGADRQAAYDSIIQQILNGALLNFRQFRDIAKLATAIENAHEFETIHVSTQKNFYREKAKHRLAIARIATYVSLMAASVTGAYQLGRTHQETDEISEQELQQELQDITFYIDGKYAIDKERNVEVFNQIVRDFQNILKISYLHSIPNDDAEELLEELKPLIEDTLLIKKEELRSLYNNSSMRMHQTVDKFFKEKKRYFRQKEVYETAPYGNLEKYKFDLFQEAQSKDYEPIIPFDPSTPNLEYIGTFIGNVGLHQQAELFGIRNADGTLKIYQKGYGNDLSNMYGAIAAKAYVVTMEKFSSYEIKEAEFDLIFNPIDAQNEDISETLEPENLYQKSRLLPKFTDPFHRFEYEILVHESWNKEKQNLQRIILARTKDEPNFTSQRGREVIEKVKKTHSTFHI